MFNNNIPTYKFFTEITHYYFSVIFFPRNCKRPKIVLRKLMPLMLLYTVEIEKFENKQKCSLYT